MKRIKIERDEQGWNYKVRCFCLNDWPPHSSRAGFGFPTARAAIAGLRESRVGSFSWSGVKLRDKGN